MSDDTVGAFADNLWQKAASHAESVKALAFEGSRRAEARGEPDLEAATFTGLFSVSIHLLIGYAFELLLKAAYLHHGGPESSLREIGHDLVAAHERATRAGFRSEVPNLSWILERLRGPHLANEFRYGATPSVTMPAFAITLPALDALVREVGSLVVPDWPLTRA